MAASSSSASSASGTPAAGEPRRGFFAKAGAIVLGAIATLAPLAAGIAAYTDPLRRKSNKGQFLRVAPLSAVPTGGAPARFQVISDRTDAWNTYAAEPIGAVYIRRTPDDKLEVFNDICPHLGCRVSFVAQRDIFQCPCHTSAFSVDGAVMSGPSPRPLDTLEYEIRGEGANAVVWVKFEDFYTGRTEKVAKA